MRRVTSSATGCRARIQNLNYHLRTPMPSVSNMWNALDTSQHLQLHKLKIDEGSKSSLLHPLLSPKSLPSLSKSTTLPPSQLMAPLPTLFLIFQVTPRCVALPVCFLFTTLQIVLILALFSLHCFSPPYTCSPIRPCYSLSIADLIFLQSSVLAPLLRYEYVPPYIRIVTTKGRYVRTCNHFVPCLSNTDALGRLGLYCLQPSSYGWGRGGEGRRLISDFHYQLKLYATVVPNTIHDVTLLLGILVPIAFNCLAHYVVQSQGRQHIACYVLTFCRVVLCPVGGPFRSVLCGFPCTTTYLDTTP